MDVRLIVQLYSGLHCIFYSISMYRKFKAMRRHQNINIKIMICVSVPNVHKDSKAELSALSRSIGSLIMLQLK